MKLMNLGIAVEKVEKKTDETQRMILIPDSVKISSKFNEGTVKFVGSGYFDRPMEVAVGDVIMY